METPVHMLEIRTLGCFSITANGKLVAVEWPDESVRELFCSLLSPLDLNFTYDRICRSILGEPDTQTSRRRLTRDVIRPLKRFLVKELGFNPIIAGPEYIRIDHRQICVDANEFRDAVVEGIRLQSHGDHPAATDRFSRAAALYSGDYLPGIKGKIITNTRNDLESLYQNVVADSTSVGKSSDCSGRNRRVGSVLYRQSNRKTADQSEHCLEESLYRGYRVF